MTSPAGTRLTLSSVAQCRGLNSLYVQHVATDALLGLVADTAPRLTILDISHSAAVTDAGLLHLTRGCCYLRELYFNPQAPPGPAPEQLVSPHTISSLLRHLPMLQVPQIDQDQETRFPTFVTRKLLFSAKRDRNMTLMTLTTHSYWDTGTCIVQCKILCRFADMKVDMYTHCAAGGGPDQPAPRH